MIFEGFFSFFGSDVTSIRFFANKLLFNLNVIFAFQSFGVRSQITVGDTQKLFKHIKIGTFIDHQNRHDAQPYSVVKRFVYILDDVFHDFNNYQK